MTNLFLLITTATDINEVQTWVAIAHLLLVILSVVGVLTTLNMQARTLKSQMEVQKMEAINTRIKLRPEVEIKTNEYWSSTSEEDYNQYPDILNVQFRVFVTNNQITNIKFVINKPVPFPEIRYDISQHDMFKREQIFIKGQHLLFEVNFNWETYTYPEEDDQHFQFLFSYDDLLGNRYGQGLIFFPNSKNKIISQQIIQPRKD